MQGCYARCIGGNSRGVRRVTQLAGSRFASHINDKLAHALGQRWNRGRRCGLYGNDGRLGRCVDRVICGARVGGVEHRTRSVLNFNIATLTGAKTDQAEIAQGSGGQATQVGGTVDDDGQTPQTRHAGDRLDSQELA